MTEGEVVGKVRTDKTANPVNGFDDGVVEVVDNGNPETLFEKLEHRVGSDEARPTRHQNR